MPRPSMPLRIDAVAISDVGLIRGRNEDAVWIGGEFMRSGEITRSFTANQAAAGLVLAVADGVGGASAGDEASEFVVTEMGPALVGFPQHGSFTGVARAIREVASTVNRRLNEAGRERPGRSGMSTTYTAIAFRKDAVCWLNAGDSRLYGYRDGALAQITRDHTLREMTGDETIPGNIIVNCFGTGGEFYCDVGLLSDSGAEFFLLCSDGLSDYASHSDIERTVAEAVTAVDGLNSTDAMGRSARQLVALAKDGGGGDNITLLLCRVVSA